MTKGQSDSDAATRLIVGAAAKINLFLHVGEERDDGYHALESLAVFAETSDILEFTFAPDLTLKITGPFARQLASDGDNLVMQAAHALAALCADKSPGAQINLEKRLPVAAGLGGGSADAAATLRALNILWRLELPETELLAIAAKIGSDVPACLLSAPCWMEGRGEHVTRVPSLPRLPLILVNPGVMVPTAQVFAHLNARSGIGALGPPPTRVETLWELVAYLEHAENDLESPASQLAPVIDDVLSALDREPGCALAQMSGSGATCFGLFHEHQFALGAAERIAQDHPEWWVRVTRIAAPAIGAPEWIP